MTDPSPLPPLPLLHNGDAFILELSSDGPHHVLLTRILRFANNEDVNPTAEPFLGLDPVTRRAIISQINRRHVGKVVRVCPSNSTS